MRERDLGKEEWRKIVREGGRERQKERVKRATQKVCGG
jgi:hypothetical protein